jgi:hypothetical protein
MVLIRVDLREGLVHESVPQMYSRAEIREIIGAVNDSIKPRINSEESRQE